jgi:hypothetical protein
VLVLSRQQTAAYHHLVSYYTTYFGTTQIVGGEVGAKVPTVADDGPILHEASVIEGFLPGNDVVMSKQHLSGGGDNLVGYGYGVVRLMPWAMNARNPRIPVVDRWSSAKAGCKGSPL